MASSDSSTRSNTRQESKRGLSEKESRGRVFAVILAGGSSRRMQGISKPIARLGRKPLLNHVVDRIAPQVEQCFISHNGDKENFDAAKLHCIADQYQPPRGPLEGILSTLLEMQRLNVEADWLLAVPVDCPFLPKQLVSELLISNELHSSPVSFARCKNRSHYLCSLWATSVIPEITEYLSDGSFSVRGLLSKLSASERYFTEDKEENFFNINSREDLAHAESLLLDD